MHPSCTPTAARPGARPPRRRSIRRAVALCAAATALATAAGGAADASASGLFTLANSSVDRLAQSTGNLYWTSHYLNEFGPSQASVFRASKSTSPGLERALYTEYYSGWFYFGDLTYALTSDWYGYFVANYPSSNISRIKRVPLAGGSAVTLATSPSFVGMRDIANDGSSLYWADATGLRKMPIGGGAVTTLVASSGIVSVGLDVSRVYYSLGASIRSIAKGGGFSTVHATTGSTVTALHIQPGSSGTTIYWGEQNAAIRSLGGGFVSTYQSALTGRRAWSVSFDGSRVLWTDCTYPNGNGCAVRKRQSGFTTTVASGGVGADNVQGDASAMFFSDSLLKKYVH
jgi:hypothetical protein